MISVKPVNPIIDWGNPITKGLVFDHPTELAYQSLDKVNNIWGELTKTGSNFPTFATRELGRTLTFSGVSGEGIIKFITKESQRNLAATTLVFVVTRNGGGGGGYGNVFRLHDGTTTSGMTFGNDNGDVGWGLRYDVKFTTSSGAWSIPYPGDTLPHVYIITYDSSSVSNNPTFWKDGKMDTKTDRVTPSGSRDHKDAYIYIGNIDQTGNVQTRTWQGDIYLSRLYNRILSSNEIIETSRDPWCIYKKPKFNILDAIAAGGTAIKDLISLGMLPFAR